MTAEYCKPNYRAFKIYGDKRNVSFQIACDGFHAGYGGRLTGLGSWDIAKIVASLDIIDVLYGFHSIPWWDGYKWEGERLEFESITLDLRTFIERYETEMTDSRRQELLSKQHGPLQEFLCGTTPAEVFIDIWESFYFDADDGFREAFESDVIAINLFIRLEKKQEKDEE